MKSKSHDETTYLLRSQKNAARLLRSLKDARAGKIKKRSLKELVSEIIVK